jgi:undecaprenyl-diphosphatase
MIAASPIQRALAWLGQRELGLLLGIAMIVAGAWIFIALADEVVEGGTAQIDRTILLAMRHSEEPHKPIGGPLVEEAARDITALGGTTVLCLFTLVVCGYLVLDGKAHMAGFVLGSVVTGLIAGSVLKAIFDRPRPDLVPHAVYTVSTSFPSGHSMMSAVTYLTLGALLARSERRKRVKAYFLVVAAFLAGAVGVTRVYLGVHWPTDVLAGWTAGAVWAILCWTAARWLQRRHRIEEEVSPPASYAPPR